MIYKKGEIYTSYDSHNSMWIWMCNGNDRGCLYALYVKIDGINSFYKNCGHGRKNSIISTTREKNWILACINANKLVSDPYKPVKIVEIW